MLARTGAEGTGDEAALAAELDSLIARIHALPRSRAAPVGSPPPARPAPPAPAPPDEPVPETPDLVGSWIAYQRHVQTEQAGIGPASLEELTAAVGRPPASRETGRAAGTVSAPATVQSEVVDVRTLLYRGERALYRARELRELAKQAPPGALPALVEEVCDLVALARES